MINQINIQDIDKKQKYFLYKKDTNNKLLNYNH